MELLKRVWRCPVHTGGGGPRPNHQASAGWWIYTSEHHRAIPGISSSCLRTQINGAYYHTTVPLKADVQGEPQQPATSQWTRIISTVKIFTTGVKVLFSDLKLINQYKEKYGRGIKVERTAPKPLGNGKSDIRYSREEFQFVYRTTKDVKKMIPTIILFLIPFIGYAAPFIAFMYPGKLLSRHFLSPSLTATLQTARCNTQRESFVSLKDKLQHGSIDSLNFIPLMIRQFSSGVSTDGGDIIFNVNTKFPADHWEDLSKGWGVESFLPSTVQQQHLRSYLEYIFICDWLLHIEGGADKLSRDELLSACLERGLNFDPEANEKEMVLKMKANLNSWIRMSTQHKECPSLLLSYMPVAQYN